MFPKISGACGHSSHSLGSQASWGLPTRGGPCFCYVGYLKSIYGCAGCVCSTRLRLRRTMIWLLTEKNASILCTCTGTTEARRWCSHVIAGFSNPTSATLRRCWWNWNVCCSAKCHLRSREWRSLSINLIMHQIMHNTQVKQDHISYRIFKLFLI